MKPTLSRLSLCLLSLLVAAPAHAANPASGTLSVDMLKLEWAGSGPYVLPNLTTEAGEPVCDVPQFCDDYSFEVDLDDDFRALPENQRESVRINIDFPVTTPTDYELYLYGPGDVLLAEASSAPGIVEAVVVPLKTLKNGSYIVRVVPYLPLATNFTGRVQVGKDSAARGMTLQPQAGSAPLAVTFDARGLSATPPASGYVFDFGDGSAPVTDADGVIEHTYLADGEYLGRVRFNDAQGGKSLVSAAQTVFVGAIDAPLKSTQRLGGALGAGLVAGLGLLALWRRQRSHTA